MDKKAKEESLDFLVGRLNTLKSVIFTNFKGLSAQDMSTIKKLAREQNGEYKVIKNTIALKAISKSGKEEVEQFISGPCAVAFLSDDPVSFVKTLVSFSKEHQALILKGGIIEGEMMSDENLKKLAALPSKNELLTSVVGNLNAPIANLVNYLHQMIFSMVSVMNSIKNKNSSDASSERIQDGGNKDVQEGSR